MAKHFNVTQMVLFLQTLPSSLQSHPPGIPLQIKLGLLFATAVALVISSYISRRSHLQSKVTELENALGYMKDTVSSLKETIFTMRRMSADLENKFSVVEQCVDFMFTNNTHVQKALYKKLQLEEKYRDGKKEPYLTKNRQQAIQEYEAARMTVARRFNEV